MTLGICSQEGCEEPATRTVVIPINQMGRLHRTLEVHFCEGHSEELRPAEAR